MRLCECRHIDSDIKFFRLLSQSSVLSTCDVIAVLPHSSGEKDTQLVRAVFNFDHEPRRCLLKVSHKSGDAFDKCTNDFVSFVAVVDS